MDPPAGSLSSMITGGCVECRSSSRIETIVQLKGDRGRQTQLGDPELLAKPSSKLPYVGQAGAGNMFPETVVLHVSSSELQSLVPQNIE